MERFTSSIEASLKEKNWFAALFLALALPDICSALETNTPTTNVGARYKDWFNRFLKDKYAPDHIPEIPEWLANEFKARLNIDEIPPQSAMHFTAEDCWKFRCQCLHQGLPERMDNDRVHFTAPMDGFSFHQNMIDDVLQISIDIFCRDISDAALVWWNTAQHDTNIATRAKSLIEIHRLDSDVLPIVTFSNM